MTKLIFNCLLNIVKTSYTGIGLPYIHRLTSLDPSNWERGLDIFRITTFSLCIIKYTDSRVELILFKSMREVFSISDDDDDELLGAFNAKDGGY